MIHTEKGSCPVLLLNELRDMGVRPEQLVFCHMDRMFSDPDVHLAILKAGAFLEYDTIGRFKYHSDAKELGLIRKMCKEGFADQLLFSLDTTRQRLRAYTPETEVGLDYILKRFLPAMRQAGISEEIIRKISRENPVRALTG